MRCPQCQSLNPEGSLYCSGCGLSRSEQRHARKSSIRPQTQGLIPQEVTPKAHFSQPKSPSNLPQNPLQTLIQGDRVLEKKFQLHKEIGRGGMGHVYSGVDLSLSRNVAIKILPPHYNEDSHIVARFRREARAMASLDHPNIVTVYSIGNDAHLHYFVMKLLQGETLAHELKRQEVGQLHPYNVRDVIELLIQACNGLEHAHNKNLLHRDIKPGNLMINRERKLTIMDFGIVKRLDDSSDTEGLKTAHGKIFGTPEYMPPEQAVGKGEYSPASDIYALGIVGFEMICGELPFKAKTPIEMILQHIRTAPPPFCGRGIGESPLFEAIIRRAMSKEPSERFENASHFRTALQGALQSEMNVQVHPLPSPPQPSEYSTVDQAVDPEYDLLSDDSFDVIDDLDELNDPEVDLISHADQSRGDNERSPQPMIPQPIQAPPFALTDPPTSTEVSRRPQTAYSNTNPNIRETPSTPSAPKSTQDPPKRGAPQTYELISVDIPQVDSPPPSKRSPPPLPPSATPDASPPSTPKFASKRPGHYSGLPIRRKKS
jgi:serine/threonine protein kinase